MVERLFNKYPLSEAGKTREVAGCGMGWSRSAIASPNIFSCVYPNILLVAECPYVSPCSFSFVSVGWKERPYVTLAFPFLLEILLWSKYFSWAFDPVAIIDEWTWWAVPCCIPFWFPGDMDFIWELWLCIDWNKASLLYSVANIVEHLCGIGWILKKNRVLGLA